MPIQDIVEKLEPKEKELTALIKDMKENPDQRVSQKRKLKGEIADLQDSLIDEMKPGDEITINGKKRKKSEKTRVKYNREGVSDFCTAKELLLEEYDAENAETHFQLVKAK